MGKFKYTSKYHARQTGEIEEAVEICGRPWKRLNICGIEITNNSKKVDLSGKEIFGFINCIMGVRAQEVKALAGKDV